MMNKCLFASIGLNEASACTKKAATSDTPLLKGVEEEGAPAVDNKEVIAGEEYTMKGDVVY